MTKKVSPKITSVALQQRSGTGVRKYARLTNQQLHIEMLEVRNDFFNRCVETQAYGIATLLPACEEIIARYKMPGVGAKDRPDGKPTVEAYFRSINLNYNTVRSWLHRKRLSTDMFNRDKTTSTNPDGKVPHLTELEAKLLGTASAGHDLVKAITHGGNLDEAIKEFEEHAPTPQRIQEFIERPVRVAATEVENLAIRLCKLIDRNDGKQGQKILALAREILAKAEPTTVQQGRGEEKKRKQREPKKEGLSQPEKTMVPPPQHTNGVERNAQ